MENKLFKELPDFIYLTIPSQWLPTYHRLLKGVAIYGIDAMKDCNVACKGNNIHSIQCWNMFQSAIAASAIGDDKAANTIINYINAQLDLLKIKTELKVVVGKDGRLYCSHNVDDEIKYFIADPFTGQLYEHHCGKDDKRYFIADDGNLMEQTK